MKTWFISRSYVQPTLNSFKDTREELKRITMPDSLHIFSRKAFEAVYAFLSGLHKACRVIWDFEHKVS